jgi:uncharacterized protein (DUF1499 family)
MNWLIGIVSAVIGLALLTLAAGQMGLLRGKPPAQLGVTDGRLKRPSSTPNSVSSQADLYPDHPMRDYARIGALPAVGGAQASIARLRAVVDAWPGATVVEQREDYLYVQFETKALRFVDDAEFWYDPAAQAIQVRSASRLGRKDFGVNRARVEAIRQKLTNRGAT